jgi:sugar phosphate isomerase/epimerase
MFKNLSMDALGVNGRQSEVIELALSFGFRGMDLDMQDFTEQVELYGLPHARRLIDSARIKIGCFRLPLIWQEWETDEVTYKRGLEQLPRIAELAVGLGCLRCISTVSPASDERPYHENFEFHRRRLAEVAEVLEPRGICLGLEFLAPAVFRTGRAFQFIDTFDALVQLAKSSGNKFVGVVIDLWHLHVSGGSIQTVRGLPAERIANVYLSDIAPGVDLERADETLRLLPGETGVIDCSAVLSLLAEIGYAGPVTVRAGRGARGSMKRDALVRSAAERLNRIWKDAGLDATGSFSKAAQN